MSVRLRRTVLALVGAFLTLAAVLIVDDARFETAAFILYFSGLGCFRLACAD